jgi:hypothetical protein
VIPPVIPVSKYLLVYSQLSCLSDEVNGAIAKGWQPFGSPVVFTTSLVLQAMVWNPESDRVARSRLG